MAKKEFDNRRSNIPVNNASKKEHINKVNGGVFVYSSPMTLAELSKQLDIPATNIIKFLFFDIKLKKSIT